MMSDAVMVDEPRRRVMVGPGGAAGLDSRLASPAHGGGDFFAVACGSGRAEQSAQNGDQSACGRGDDRAVPCYGLELCSEGHHMAAAVVTV